MLKQSMFGLEIERGRRIMNRSLLLVIFFLLIVTGVTYVNLSIAPTLPPELLRPPTPTPNIFATPLSSPTPSGVQATATIFLAPTVTLGAPQPTDGLQAPEEQESEPQPAGIQSPTPQTPQAIAPTRPGTNCVPDINITSPPDGAAASTSITFFGTATGEDFGYFDLEVNGPQSNDLWASLPVEDATRPVFDGILASVDVSNWRPGPHTFRLSVYDSADSSVGQCELQLDVTSPGS